MKDMTLGAKIMMGFGIVLTIMLILGGIGVVNMNTAKNNAEAMANERVPQVDVSYKVADEANMMRYGVRGFAYTENLNDLKSAKENIANLKNALALAKQHAAKYNLQVLKAEEEKASKALEGYLSSLERSEKLQTQRVELRKAMNENATEFVKNITTYLEAQEEIAISDVKSGAGTERILERITKLTEMNDLLNIGNTVRIEVQRAQAQRNTEGLAKAIKRFPDLYKHADDILKTTRQQVNIDLINAIKKSAQNYEKAVEAFIDNANTEASENKLRVELGGDIIEAASASMGVGIKRTVEDSNNSLNSLTTATTTMIIGLIVALIIGIVAALGIIRSITRPTIEAVRTIAEANNQVVAASDQIAASSQSLAEGASEQASSVEEVSATVEESTATNNQNAENGREADNLARAAHEAAKTGNHKIQDLMTAMEKITDSSQRIAKIIKTIDEIAFQTNLLALNAAVEAARAGEHGLGFAVVADEVKNLAQRSADAAKETAGIIEEAIEEIKNGNQIAKDTNESFAEILDKAKKTSDLIGEISASIKEQAEGMNQIATAMGQIDQVTQQNAANSEEAAAAAEELNAQALAMMQSTREIAKIVGFDIEREVGTHGTSKPTRKAPPKLAAHPHKALIEKKPKPAPRKETRKSDDDVFPLDEDDMKEF